MLGTVCYNKAILSAYVFIKNECLCLFALNDLKMGT